MEIKEFSNVVLDGCVINVIRVTERVVVIGQSEHYGRVGVGGGGVGGGVGGGGGCVVCRRGREDEIVLYVYNSEQSADQCPVGRERVRGWEDGRMGDWEDGSGG